MLKCIGGIINCTFTVNVRDVSSAANPTINLITNRGAAVTPPPMLALARAALGSPAMSFVEVSLGASEEQNCCFDLSNLPKASRSLVASSEGK